MLDETLSIHEKLEHLIYFLQYIGNVLKEESVELKEETLKLKKQFKNIDYENGSLFTYFRVISLIQNHANSFDIPLSVFSLDDFKPDILLVDKTDQNN
jgi:hypothetical protein